ncbi:MAG TPA: acyl-CoA dehydrogenase family protein [Usitatibacter sp.]|nr:acyl-CoA dehydrogenase family protein [Usitatibacter sp.]
MKFDYSEEQRLVADSVRRFVQQDYGFEARRKIVASHEGWSRETWAKLAEIGLLGLPFPTEHGGFGGRAIDLFSVMEAFGEALLVEPYLATVGLAGRLIARVGSEAQKQEMLPAIAEGRLVMAFAHTEDGARYDLSHVRTAVTPAKAGARSSLTGRKRFVLHAPCADKLVVSARDGNAIRLFIVNRADVTLHPYLTLDGMRAADVELDGAKAEPLGEGDALPAIEEAVDYATALLCAEAVGAMKSANDATLEYLKIRKQFGVPIGSFQALQHRMVDMVIDCEQARSMASLACARVDGAIDAVERARIVSAAKIKIADAARHVSQESVQLHGGMGMSDELKVSHTFRRLTMIARELGDVDHHLERYARVSGRRD